MSKINHHPPSIRVAIAGVGNCACSLVQGVDYYGSGDGEPEVGLMRPVIGDWRCADITFVAAFDIDHRKIGLPLGSAIFAPPNRAMRFRPEPVTPGPIVQMGPVLDGVAEHMADHPAERAFRAADLPPVDVAAVLKAVQADVLVSYMPVGADQATQYYAEACLSAGCAMVNCTPSFIASDAAWAKRFDDAGLPIIGDDIKSQLGATILHRMLARLFNDRGMRIDRTYQLNIGGNTDFLNMLARDRLASKKLSKTLAVQSQLDTPLASDNILIGPSDYVPWQDDGKVAFIRLEGSGFGGAPIELELRLSVQDSPNSAGVVIDAIRYAALGRQRGQGGPLEAACAWLMKSPPRQIRDDEAKRDLDLFLAGG